MRTCAHANMRTREHGDLQHCRLRLLNNADTAQHTSQATHDHNTTLLPKMTIDNADTAHQSINTRTITTPCDDDHHSLTSTSTKDK